MKFEKLAVQGQTLMKCIMGIFGAHIFGAWPLLETKNEDISTSGASFLTILIYI